MVKKIVFTVMIVTLCLVFPNKSFAALGATTVWEIRTTGSDNNGGGYTSGGTDYSQQDAAELSPTDLACLDTTTTLTSANGGFTSAMVGNLIQIVSGTQDVPGWYEIATYVDTNEVTIDRTCAVGGQNMTSGVGYVGGALASIGQLGKCLAVSQVSGMKAWLKAGTYTCTTTSVNVSGGPLDFNTYTSRLMFTLEGYSSSRGDLGTRPVLSAGAQNVAFLIYLNGYTAEPATVINVKGDANSQSNADCFLATHNSTDSYILCEAHNADGTNKAGFKTARTYYCYAKDNSWNFSGTPSKYCYAEGGSYGFVSAATGSSHCVASGASIDGFYHGTGGIVYTNFTAYGCADGFDLGGNPVLIGCYAGDCTAYGFNTLATDILIDCAGYNNTSGNTNVTPVRNINFQAITDGQPLDDPANADYQPNATANRGDLLRDALQSTPTIVGNNQDIGALQHDDPAGGGGGGATGFIAMF